MRKIAGLVVVGLLMFSAVLGHFRNAGGGATPVTLAAAAPVEAMPVLAGNLAVPMPPRFARLTPALSASMDAVEGGHGYAEDLTRGELVMVGRTIPAGPDVLHSELSLGRVALGLAPAAVTEAWCQQQMQAAAQLLGQTLSRAELRSEPAGIACRGELIRADRPHDRITAAVLVTEGDDWNVTCLSDERAPADVAACDELLASIRLQPT